MDDHMAARAQPLTGGMRNMLYAASGLVFAVGITLYLLTEQTDRYFAWTIQSALTAAFLGGAYWSACALEFIAARRLLWADARVAAPAVISFTALTFVVTLLHLDRFHFGAPELITRAGTWFWLAVYASVPVIMTALLLHQLRAPGVDPPREMAMPDWMRLLLLGIAALLLVLGLALLAVPEAVAPLWPWPLTALTGRAVGAWLIGLGVAAGHAARERDLLRARPVMVSAVVFCVLQFIALARYAGEFAWGSASGWVYLLFLVVFLGIGAYGWLATQRVRGHETLAGRGQV
jgi:hypothetical protein